MSQTQNVDLQPVSAKKAAGGIGLELFE